MKLRGKLLILLLVIALVPLLLSTVLHQVTMRRLGNRLVNDARNYQEERAYQFLQGKVTDFGAILRRDQEALQLALEFQAREVEARLAAGEPLRTGGMPAIDFYRADSAPAGLRLSDRHLRAGADGQLRPLPVSYADQVLSLAPNADPKPAAVDAGRMASLPDAYRRIHQTLPSLIYWQYTALETGVHSRYPWHGDARLDLDPRTHPWYREAFSRQGQVRLVTTDSTTGKPLLTLAQPIRRADGSFAGVTAIDVAYDRLFADWRRPERWAGQAESLVVVLHPANDNPDKIEILLRESLPGAGVDWEIPVERKFIDSKDREELAALQDDVREGRTGVRKMDWNGQEALLAYSPGPAGEPFPLIVVPFNLVLALAERAETYFNEQIQTGLKLYVTLMLAVIAWVFLTAYFRARSVTRPVTQLAEAANHLARGDFEKKVDLRTGDELQALGDTFNKMGTQLKEHMELKRSLLLAREIQQMLLPAGAPRFAGFDIAGQTRYCDETGGDYFDFIDLGPSRLGVAVGDVTGHGVGAALLMAAARGVLRSQAARSGLAMDQLFGDLNRHLVADTADTLFMTLFYGIIDSENRTFHWISAGHGPVLHFSRQSGHFAELPSTGIPLGILADATYDTAGPRILQRGDILLVGTDGIWETESPAGELFGIGRLQQAVAGAAERTAAEVLAAVMTSVVSFRGGVARQDDQTLIVVKS